MRSTDNKLLLLNNKNTQSSDSCFIAYNQKHNSLYITESTSRAKITTFLGAMLCRNHLNPTVSTILNRPSSFNPTSSPGQEHARSEITHKRAKAKTFTQLLVFFYHESPKNRITPPKIKDQELTSTKLVNLGSRLTTSRCTCDQEKTQINTHKSNQRQDGISFAGSPSPRTRPCASPSPRAGRSTWPAASSPADSAAGWTGSAAHSGKNRYGFRSRRGGEQKRLNAGSLPWRRMTAIAGARGFGGRGAIWSFGRRKGRKDAFFFSFRFSLGFGRLVAWLGLHLLKCLPCVSHLFYIFDQIDNP